MDYLHIIQKVHVRLFCALIRAARRPWERVVSSSGPAGLVTSWCAEGSCSRRYSVRSTGAASPPLHRRATYPSSSPTSSERRQSEKVTGSHFLSFFLILEDMSPFCWVTDTSGMRLLVTAPLSMCYMFREIHLWCELTSWQPAEPIAEPISSIYLSRY